HLSGFVPNDPLYKDQWHLRRVQSESAWGYSCGQGVTVAVIDTGVACYDHGAFSKGTDLKGTRCDAGYDFVNDRSEAADDHGHGTHVAGTIAQTTNNGAGVAGLAHCARLMPIKVLSKTGSGTVADVASGIRFAADNGAQVINMSLGGRIKSKVLESAVAHAVSKGVIVVAAAGNTSRSVEWPAAYPGVIAVSATNDKDGLAWFSSRGPEVAIAAPGVDVTQQTICNQGKDGCEIFGTFSGTSMAAPHVAGAAALIVGEGVTDPAAVREVLQKAASAPSNGANDPNKFGAGILDAASAVAHAHWAHVALRGILLLGLGLWISRRIKKLGGTMNTGLGMKIGALASSVGLLFFLPLTGVAPHLGRFRWIAELAQRPLGEWDLVFSASFHRFLPLANALPALVLAGLFFGTKRLRPFAGGIALGSAALLAQIAFSADVATPFGHTLLRVWTISNAMVCLWLARLSLDQKS
ncbi:MAG: S8 family peptidase, partial [Polyangiales bacterium]